MGTSAVEVVAVTGRRSVLAHMNLYVQIPADAPVSPLPFRRRDGCDPRYPPAGILTRQGLVFSALPHGTCGTDPDDLAATVTVGQGAAPRRSLAHSAPGRSRGRCGLGLAAGMGTGAVAHPAVDPGRDLDLLGASPRTASSSVSPCCMPSATGRAATTAPATTEDVAKHVAEDVAEIGTTAKAPPWPPPWLDPPRHDRTGHNGHEFRRSDLVGFPLTSFELQPASPWLRSGILHGQMLVRVSDLAPRRHLSTPPSTSVEIALDILHPVAISAKTCRRALVTNACKFMDHLPPT